MSSILSDNEATEMRVADILDQYLQDIEKGNEITPEQLVDRHPDLADALREYLDGIQLLERAAGSIRQFAKKSSQHPEVKRLGDYTIGREIGRGGMGVVYEAHQISLDRTVALKVLPFAAILDPKQIQRFQNEAQAAARLNHPNIVPVYGVGCERSTYFYSMQMIEGRSLDQVIDALRRSSNSDPQINSAHSAASTLDTIANHNSKQSFSKQSFVTTIKSIRNRNYTSSVAKLGIQAAQALAYAHDCGIVHRDIKPSNLLIDQCGKLWVTDFGLAHSSNVQSLTKSGDIVGTLRYMSPEQASGKSYLVDHRADIYSLGATLFEMLTLIPLHDGLDLRTLAKRIDNDPPRSLRKLNPSVPLDMETVLLKAISRDRQDRYATASEFADELQRVLDGRSIQAKRPGWFDRCSKLVTRNPVRVLAVVVSILSLAIIASIASYVLIQKNRQIARSEAVASHHLEIAKQVIDRFGGGLVSELELIPGTEKIRKRLIQNSLQFYDSFDGQSTDTEWLIAYARANVKSASLYEGMQAASLAEEKYRNAIASYRKLESIEKSSELHAELSFCEGSLASLLLRSGKAEEGTELLHDSLRVAKRLAESNRGDERSQNVYLIALLRSSLFQLETLGPNDVADEKTNYLTEALERLGEIPKGISGQQDALEEIANGLSNLARKESLSKDQRLQALRAELRLRKRMLETTQDAPRTQYAIALCRSSFASELFAAGKVEEACSESEQAISQLEQLLANNPAAKQYRLDLANCRNNLGKWMLGRNRFDEARKLLQKSKEDFDSLCKETPSATTFSGLGAALHNLAILHDRTQNQQASRTAIREAIANQETAVRMQPKTPEFQTMLAEHQRYLGSLGGTR